MSHIYGTSLQRHPALYVAASPARGRGVFTAEALAAGDVVEVCPVIVCPTTDYERVHASLLHDYYFTWEPEGATAIALGYGSLYNHADAPNCEYAMDIDAQTLTVSALKDVAAGEELTFDYTDGVDRSTLWFAAAK